MRHNPITIIRVAYWRQAVGSTPCPACGAAAGHGCSIGKFPQDCFGCDRLGRCPTSGQLHLVRFNAWLRPGPVAKAPGVPQAATAPTPMPEGAPTV